MIQPVLWLHRASATPEYAENSTTACPQQSAAKFNYYKP